MIEAIDIIEQALREGQDYTVKQMANRVGISTTLTGRCLRSLERGGICTRQKIAVGKTRDGRDKKVFHYRTKQRDINFAGGGG